MWWKNAFLIGSLTSGKLQGTVLGSFLFVIYIHEMEVDEGGMISKFADDKKRKVA